MVITPHVLVGSLIYKVCEKLFQRHNIELNQSPLLCLMVLFLSFSSHFLLDNIPHTEYSLTTPIPIPRSMIFKLLLDASLSIFLLFLAINCYPSWQNIKKTWAIMLAGFAGILPDAITRLSDMFHWNLWFADSHDYSHGNIIPTFWVGIWTQVFTILIAGLLLRYLSKVKTL